MQKNISHKKKISSNTFLYVPTKYKINRARALNDKKDRATLGG